MKSLADRQQHLLRLIKTLDRALAEREGIKGLPISHYQAPQAAPGERESVCVHGLGGKKRLLPYGVTLENQVGEARRWVREGEGKRPVVSRSPRGQFLLTTEVPDSHEVLPLVDVSIVRKMSQR